MMHLETSVQLALIGSATTLLAQVITFVAGALRARRSRDERAALAVQVRQHNAVVNEKLDANTALTEQTSEKASQAYAEANSFNQKFAAIAAFESGVQRELVRLSQNIHAIANALTPVVGEIILAKRQEPNSDKG